jgi:hypothetical protein
VKTTFSFGKHSPFIKRAKVNIELISFEGGHHNHKDIFETSFKQTYTSMKPNLSGNGG